MVDDMMADEPELDESRVFLNRTRGMDMEQLRKKFPEYFSIKRFGEEYNDLTIEHIWYGEPEALRYLIENRVVKEEHMRELANPNE